MSNQNPVSHNVILICRNADGAPSFFCAKVICTPDEYDEVDHLDMVCEAAEAAGMTIAEGVPYLCDMSDPLGEGLDYAADWDAAPTLNLAEYNANTAAAVD